MEEETLSALTGGAQKIVKPSDMIRYIERYGANIDREIALKIGRIINDMGDGQLLQDTKVGCSVILDSLAPSTLTAVYSALMQYMKK